MGSPEDLKTFLTKQEEFKNKSTKTIICDIDGTLLVEPILDVGDCSVTLGGGHTYKILEDDTLVYEYKTGPYKGQQNDKEFIE